MDSFLPVRSYAFVVQFNSPLYDIFSVAISKLQDSGFIEAKRKIYWDSANECTTDNTETGTYPDKALSYTKDANLGVALESNGSLL